MSGIIDGLLSEWSMTAKQRAKLEKQRAENRLMPAVAGQKLSEGVVALDQTVARTYRTTKVTTRRWTDADGKSVEEVSEETIDNTPAHIHKMVVSQSEVPDSITRIIKKEQ